MTEHRRRYRRILRFAARYLAQSWWYEIALPKLGLARLAERTRARRMQRIAERFHALAIELGGLMIKVGQFLSSRLDVLPPEITSELEGLQDEVPPVPFDRIRELAERELGVRLDEAFAHVDAVPVAAASLGQAHRAVLAPELADDTGFSAVVLKVQRPGIDAIVDVDLAALRRVGGWLRRVRIVSDRVDAPQLVEEFAQTSLEEIDYLAEAAHGERFAQLFDGDDRVSTPEIVWERSSRRVLTLSDVTAIKITDVDALRAAGIDPQAVAQCFADVMFDQLFTFGYFHADPHPGNIFVAPRAEGGWSLAFIDFGMMGSVPDEIRRGLRALMIAVASRDSTGVVAAVEDIGVLLPSADTRELERAMSALFSRFGGMGFAELRDVDPREFRDFGLEFRDVIRTLPFQLPENFLLIVRAMSLTSGVCTSIDPAFNLWDAVEPYASQLLRDERGNLIREFSENAVSTLGTLAALPRRVDALLTSVDQGRLVFDTSSVERRLARLEQLGRRIISAVLFLALLVGGILVMPEYPVIGTVMCVAAAPLLLHALLAGAFGRPPR
ncbi:AarF/UbiB family protein [Leucobacter tardus]|uniref:ABC1 kinase family protein n=1 Tax=Leucobacter tardus TaxID=501483 RepID=UPI0027DBF178|nr:AarF/UbiB family protein [Leucobacter tardus]